MPTAETYPGGVTATMGTLSIHNQFRQKYTPTTLDPSFWRLLNYDQVGRVDVQHRLSAGNTAVRNFKYDTRGRLKAVFDSTALTGNPPCETLTDLDYGGALCGNPTVNFNGLDSVSYSPIGNPKYLRQGWGAESVFYNSGFGSRMTKWPRGAPNTFYTYGYNPAGARQKMYRGLPDSTYYRWTPDGLLDTVRIGVGATVKRRITYDYNAFGELVRRRINGTTDRHFVWDRDNLLAELDGALGARRSEYAHYPGLDRPFAMLTGATAITQTRYVHADPLGNVIGLTKPDGTVDTDLLGTNEWGFPTSIGVTQADTMRLRWKGMFYEADSTQLYYVRARWYDPVARRFISEDPIGLEGGINPYSFGGNDPVNMSDPLGLGPCSEEAMAQGGVSRYIETDEGSGGWWCQMPLTLPGVTTVGWNPWRNYSGPTGNFGNPCARGGFCGTLPYSQWPHVGYRPPTSSNPAASGAARPSLYPWEVVGLAGLAKNSSALLTSKQATDLARYLGYTPQRRFFMGQRVFSNGRFLISQDRTMHLGAEATWKMFRPDMTRVGTFDALLIKRLGQ